MPGTKPQKISSVLARFEQTIQENEKAGGEGGGGMYLTNVAGGKRRPGLKPMISSRSLDGNAPVGRSASSRMNVAAGSYRNFLQGDAESDSGARKTLDTNSNSTTSTFPEEDPFAESDSEFSESCFEEDGEGGEEEEHRRKSSSRRAARPSTSKRVGRLGNRKTRTSRSDRTRRQTSIKEEEEEEDPSEEEEANDGFAVSSSSKLDEPRARSGTSRQRSTSSAQRSRHGGSSRSAARRPSRR